MKKQRGMMGYVVLIASFVIIALILNGAMGPARDPRIEYPQLLNAIREDNVKAVAIRNNALVGLYRNGKVADADFPERAYDFETTIGADFIDTVRQMTASQQGKALTGTLMLLCYSLGLGLPFLVSAVLIDQLKSTFDFIKRNYKIINIVSGCLLILVGILMATGLLGLWMAALQ